MFIFTELSNVLLGVLKRHSKILCCDPLFGHGESRTGVRRKMSILNYFKRKETPSECLERIDKNIDIRTRNSLEAGRFSIVPSHKLEMCIQTEPGEAV